MDETEGRTQTEDVSEQNTDDSYMANSFDNPGKMGS